MTSRRQIGGLVPRSAAFRVMTSDDVLAGFGLGCAGHDLPILSASDIGEDVSTALLCGMPLPMAKRW
jgi:hypothetical protein